MRVQVASDFVLLRAGLQALLSNSLNPELVSESAGGFAMVENARRVQPHILVVDIAQDDPHTFEMIDALKNQIPSIKIIALTENEDTGLAIRLLRAGVTGCLSRRESPVELAQAVETVARGEVFLCSSASDALLKEYRGQSRPLAGTHAKKAI